MAPPPPPPPALPHVKSQFLKVFVTSTNATFLVSRPPSTRSFCASESLVAHARRDFGFFFITERGGRRLKPDPFSLRPPCRTRPPGPTSPP